MIKQVNQFIVFTLELIMFIALGYYGMTRDWSILPRVLFTIAIITMTITLWGIFAAPKSAYRLEMPYLAIFRGIMFLSASFLFSQLGIKTLAITLAALAVMTQTLSYFTEQQPSK